VPPLTEGSKPLPRLRANLDVMPSPSPEHPGLLLRCPYRYTDAMLVIPPSLIPALACLDGVTTESQLNETLERQLGGRLPAGLLSHLVETLGSNGFLHTEDYERMRDKRHAEFRDLAERRAAHAGSAYPDHPERLRQEFGGYFGQNDSVPAPPATESGGSVVGIAAPHVSPVGGWRSYAAAYSQLAAMDGAAGHRTYVVLGTSHYGQPEKFGLTRKPFVTPYGALPVDTELVERLADAAPESVLMEDYCHSIEHSIEFQCVFLQHVLGERAKTARILPILCGSFFESLSTGRPPESDRQVNRFFEALREMAAAKGSNLFWVLGVDMAHIGRRYGDDFEARSDKGQMLAVRERDMERLDHYCRGDAAGFYDLVRVNEDELRWCGYAPLYTFLQAVPEARGRILNYEQWQIDEQSVVSCAALEFQQSRAVRERPPEPAASDK
jgi:AmmeMemoRadiSam system protein B